jgi:hypothetical protein
MPQCVAANNLPTPTLQHQQQQLLASAAAY